MRFQKADDFIVPTFLIGLFVFLPVWYWGNYKFYILGENNVFMKPTFGPKSSRFARYWGVQEIKGDARDKAVEFVTPDGNGLSVGRVIATPGQIVEVRDRKVFVNGQELDEPYLQSKATRPAVRRIMVPARCLFVLGDERSGRGASGSDSRWYGPIPMDSVQRIFTVETGDFRKRKG